MQANQTKPVINCVADLTAVLMNNQTFNSLKQVLIMLDYDGTLVPFAARPEQAVPGSEVVQILGQLTMRKDVNLAIISGRTLAQLEGLLPPRGLIIAALHGAVVKYPGGKAKLMLESAEARFLRKSIQKLRDHLQNSELPEGFWVENKSLCLTVHYRGVPDNQVTKGVKRVIEGLTPLLEKGGLELTAGDKVLEIRPRSIDKGQVARNLLDRHPDYYPLYFGDDYTDEDAFEELKGKGLTVRVSENTRETAADYQLRHPEEVVQFIGEVINLLDRFET